jgi:Ca2+/Na+ antiporter
VFPVVGSTGFNLCLAVGFIFIIVFRATALTAFMLCFVLYSLRVQICVLFPAIVEKAKISHQLSGHLCTYVNHLSNTKIVGSRYCIAWNISADMNVSLHASGYSTREVVC